MKGMAKTALPLLLALAGGFAFWAGTPLLAGEHPEHPKKPEGSHEGTAPAAVTVKEIGEAIQAFVKTDVDLKGGYFLIYDKEAKKPLVLALDHVHEDKLSSIGGGVHFACVDFKTEDGKQLYDVDFFLKGNDPKALAVTEIMVHKEDGKPRYNWKEDGGVWKREGAMPEGSHEGGGDQPKGPENPEHPK